MALYGAWFGHDSIRKLLVVFGSLFDSISVVRFNPDGSIGEIIKRVPIELEPGDKRFIRQAIQETDDGPLASKGHSVYPRMTYDFVGISLNNGRLSMTSQRFLRHEDAPDGKVGVMHWWTPYDVELVLKIASRSQSDSFQILEQILPFFNPNVTVVMRDPADENRHLDVPIRLVGITHEDNNDALPSENVYQVIHTLTFIAEYNLSGPIGNQREQAVAEKIGGPGATLPVHKSRIEKLVIDYQFQEDGFFESGNASSHVNVTPGPTPDDPNIERVDGPPDLP